MPDLTDFHEVYDFNDVPRAGIDGFSHYAMSVLLRLWHGPNGPHRPHRQGNCFLYNLCVR